MTDQRYQALVDTTIQRIVRWAGGTRWEWAPWAERTLSDDGQIVFADGTRSKVCSVIDHYEKVTS